MRLKHVGESISTATEVLVVRGLLTDDLRFMPIFCSSEFRRRKLVETRGSDIELALLDQDGKTLLKDQAGIRETIECSPHIPRASVVEGSIPLRAGAQRLRIRKGGLDVVELKIGERPTLKVAWTETAVTREGKYVLRLDYSEPTEDAMVKIFFRWGPEQYLLGSAGKPAKETVVTFRGMPGGDRCQLIVAYTSGLRTTVGRTTPFKLAPLAPKVEIMRPRAGQVFAAWHPVELQGQVRDRQRGEVPPEECVWTLKGKEIGRGLLAYAGFLEPGLYDALLRYGKIQQSIKFRVTEEGQ